MDRGAVPPDISHDVSGGTAKWDMALVMLSLEKQGHISWSDLQIFALDFRKTLKGHDSQSWFSVLGDKVNFKHLPGNHACNHAFVRMFSYLCAKFPADSDVRIIFAIL